MSLCKHCVSGVTHEGTPEGKIETINGIESYIATPSTDYPKDKAILFLTDAFGIPFNNNKLIVDAFARNGYKTIIPDLFNGDAIPIEAMEKGEFDINAWFPNHMQAQTRPAIDKVIAGLKEQGVKEFLAIGYCFGARYAFDLAFENIVKVVVVNHPSLLQNPADLEKYLSQAKAPLLINSCETDPQFPPDFQAKADEILKDKFAPGYKREYWAGCTHGFAVRGDISNPTIKASKEGAFKAAVEWFGTHA